MTREEMRADPKYAGVDNYKHPRRIPHYVVTLPKRNKEGGRLS